MSKEFLKELLFTPESEFIQKYDGMKISEFKESIRIALLEQDRDTRHAIAENLHTIEGTSHEDLGKVFSYDSLSSYIINNHGGISDWQKQSISE